MRIKTIIAAALLLAPLPAQAMEGHEEPLFWRLTLDQLERHWQDGQDATSWKLDGFIGGDYEKVRIKSEGEATDGHGVEELEVQALYSVMVDDFWDFQVGIRHDFRPQPRTSYATIGFQGLAPQFLEVDAQAFLSEHGDLTARLETEIDLPLTRQLILQPHAEIDLSAQDVPSQAVGTGVSALGLGLRLRYEIVQEVAPYIGLSWEKRLGDSARFSRALGEDPDRVSFLTGLRLWF